MTNSETVKYVYDKFAKGDVPALLATFDSNIEFRLAEGHPYSPEGRPWIGGEAITRNFFAKGSEWDGWSIGIHSLEHFGDIVVVQGRYGGVYKPTGRKMDVQVCHLWKFREGKIISFRQYLDTAALQAVMCAVP